MPRRALDWILLAALTAAPAMVHAQPAGGHPEHANDRRATATALPGRGPAPAPAPAPRLVAERQRLRIELDRVNSEIDALKHDRGGLRDDYRLRNRMADAEALARRLTEVDARLHAQAGASGTAGGAVSGGLAGATAPWPAAPQAQPSDDRAALEAKADILADQARRLNGQIDVLAARVTAVRARQELRRRAGQLEHDPFAQMDQGKRRLATSGGPPPVSPGPKTDVSTPSPPSRGEPSPSAAGVGTVSGPAGAASTPTLGPTSIPQTTATSSAAGSLDKAQPALLSPSASPAGGGADGAAASVTTQFAGLLDASTLAEIRRLEVGGGGSPGSSAAALERAVSALRARAAQLTASAEALRSRAKTAP